VRIKVMQRRTTLSVVLTELLVEGLLLLARGAVGSA